MEEWYFISGVIEPEKMNREGERGRDRESARNGKYIMKAWICIKKSCTQRRKKLTEVVTQQTSLCISGKPDKQQIH